MKRCGRCGVEKSQQEFFKNRSRKDQLTCWCKNCDKQYKVRYRLLNKAKIRGQRRLYANRKYKTDPQFKLASRLRIRLYKALKLRCKSGSAVRDLGCSIAKFKLWVEMFMTEGMAWNNWGCGPDKWHLDHVIPLSSFDLTDRAQLLKAVHYTNIRPMWQTDNLRKRASLTYQICGERSGSNVLSDKSTANLTIGV